MAIHPEYVADERRRTLCGANAIAVAGAAAGFGTEIPGIAGTHQLVV